MSHEEALPPALKLRTAHHLRTDDPLYEGVASVMERLFFHVLDSVARNKQVLDVNLHAEMMLFPGANRRVMAARNWLAIEMDVGHANPEGSKLWATWRCETSEAFTNHLLATDPVKV